MTLTVEHRSRAAIERDARMLLLEYRETSGVRLELPVPLEDITRYHLALDLGFADLYDLVDSDEERYRGEILGAIFMGQERILIDSHLDPASNPSLIGRYRFSVGHEIGHWRLHREAVLQYARHCASGRQDADVVCRASEAKKPIEWQADYFAACLLMPQAILKSIWCERFRGLQPLVYERTRRTVLINPPRGRGLRHIGQVLSDPGYEEFADGWANYFASQFFNVSTQAMRIRLEGMGLLVRSRVTSLAS